MLITTCVFPAICAGGIGLVRISCWRRGTFPGSLSRAMVSIPELASMPVMEMLGNRLLERSLRVFRPVPQPKSRKLSEEEVGGSVLRSCWLSCGKAIVLMYMSSSC